MGFRIKFWGVRGSIACPSPDHIRYGGNTSCVEMEIAGNRLVFDAGTGIRSLGQDLLSSGANDVKLLLTHTHWDHINGFPFFMPAYDPNSSLHILAGHLKQRGATIHDVLSTLMDNPTFPVPLEAMQAKVKTEDFQAGEDLEIFKTVNIRTAPLNHPNGATAYRVEWEGKAVCYVTDTEHRPGEDDLNILGLIEGADLVIYDSTYTEEEFAHKIGWGHSTWNEGSRLCRMAGVKRLAIFHHDPDHDDNFMDKVAEDARKEWDKAFVAMEGKELIVA